MLSGIVTDGAGGAPLAEVRVQIDPAHFTVTGADGRFTLNVGSIAVRSPEPSPLVSGDTRLWNLQGHSIDERSSAQGFFYVLRPRAPGFAMKASASEWKLSCYKTGYARGEKTGSGDQAGLAIALAKDPTGLGYHDMLYAGEANNDLWLIRGGKVAWQWTRPNGGEFGDVSLMADGNIIFARGKVGASVIAPDKSFLWNYATRGGESQVHTTQPLGPDKVLICENGTPPMASVWNWKTNTKLWEMVLPTREPITTTSIHGQVRHIRLLANGHLLVPHMNLGTVVEYDTATRKPVWSCSAKSAWAAVRLKNGNTLLSGNDGNWVREIDNACNTVWEVTQADMPAGVTLKRIQECMRLGNGNTIVNIQAAATGAPQVIEVTPDKKVVWKLISWTDPNLKGGSSTQILDEPGAMENLELMR